MRKSTRTSLVASLIATAAALAAAPAFADIPHAVFNGGGAGNDQWNGSYNVWLGIQTRQDMINHAPPGIGPILDATLASDALIMGGSADAYATMFGDREHVLHAEAKAIRSSGALSAKYDLDWMGLTLFSGNVGSGVSLTLPITFFEASETFDIVFVPVTVTATAGGELGVKDVKATLSSSTIALTGTPYGKVTVDGSVGVGAGCLSAGIEGDLDVLQVSAPVTAKVNIPSSGSPTFSVKADLTLSTLDGAFGFYADGCIARADYWLVAWPGVPIATWNLLNTNGTL